MEKELWGKKELAQGVLVTEGQTIKSYQVLEFQVDEKVNILQLSGSRWAGEY